MTSTLQQPAGFSGPNRRSVLRRLGRQASTGMPPTFAPRSAALLPPGTQQLTFRVGYPVRDGRPTARRSVAMVTR